MTRHSDERSRLWRTSKLPTRPASAEANNGSNTSRAEVKHNGNPNSFPLVDDQSNKHFNHRQLTLRTPATRPRRPSMPSHDEARPPPSAKNKRGADPISSALEPPAKKSASKGIKTELTPADVAFARQGKTKQVRFSSLNGQQPYQPSDGMHHDGSDMSESPPPNPRRKPPVWGMDPFQIKYEKNTTSTSKPALAGVEAQSSTATTDVGDRRKSCLLEIDFGTRVPGPACRACGSPRHKTKDCHVPFNDGTAVICPFHDCSVLDKTVDPHHPLDILMTFQVGQAWKLAPHCPLAMGYKIAVREKDRERMRYMLPQLFGELVLSRKRKPPIRVVNPELCPIAIAIEFSRAFCQGQMPSGLQGVWPYTMRDATSPAILAKLQQYDKLGWLYMPPGELEAKSWDQIKREYAQGIIPVQMPRPGKFHIKMYEKDMERRAAAEAKAKEVEYHSPDANLELHSIEEDSDSKDAGDGEDALPPHSQDTALMQEMLRLSAKVDSMAETLNDLKGKQRGYGVKAEPGSRAQGTWSDPIDVDTVKRSIGWYVE